MAAPETAALARIRGQVASALTQPRHVLAVSGGVDSMVLLHAAAAIAAPGTFLVATFDHGTGPAATAAAHLVREQRQRPRDHQASSARHHVRGRTEAEWRHQRWHFLHEVAADMQGAIVTAHTRDDQIETVFMRILRDAGPRGLAALYAESPIIRPLLAVPRATILEYAEQTRVIFVTDPSNTDRRHLRNRVRHDLLPAITAIHPDFGVALLALAHKSAAWRAQMDQIAATFTEMTDVRTDSSCPSCPVRWLHDRRFVCPLALHRRPCRDCHGLARNPSSLFVYYRG